MADALRLAAHTEPLGLAARPTAPPKAWPTLRALRFEYSSRGDRVGGRVLLPPEGTAPAPLVLLQHGLGHSAEASYLEATGAPWSARGAAVACIDLPLHGARADRKLTQRLALGLTGADPFGAELALEFARQAIIDMKRAVDALVTLDAIDSERIAFAGFSLGAMLGAVFCALDPRPRAAALALAGGGFGPSGTDPVEYIGRVAPRPVLLVNARRDSVVSPAAAEALFEAARQPKQQHWFDTDHGTLPGAALKAMLEFLSGPLALAEPAPPPDS